MFTTWAWEQRRRYWVWSNWSVVVQSLPFEGLSKESELGLISSLPVSRTLQVAADAVRFKWTIAKWMKESAIEWNVLDVSSDYLWFCDSDKFNWVVFPWDWFLIGLQSNGSEGWSHDFLVHDCLVFGLWCLGHWGPKCWVSLPPHDFCLLLEWASWQHGGLRIVRFSHGGWFPQAGSS